MSTCAPFHSESELLIFCSWDLVLTCHQHKGLKSLYIIPLEILFQVVSNENFRLPPCRNPPTTAQDHPVRMQWEKSVSAEGTWGAVTRRSRSDLLPPFPKVTVCSIDKDIKTKGEGSSPGPRKCPRRAPTPGCQIWCTWPIWSVTCFF